MSPRKVRLVADAIRGMDVDEAEIHLEHIPKGAAMPLKKLLQSAIANALHNFQKDRSALFIQSLTVDKGPVLKRFRPRAFGRASDIHKQTSHIKLILGERAVIRPKRFAARLTKKNEKPKNEATLEEMSESQQGKKPAEDFSARSARRHESRGIKRTFTDISKRFFQRKSV